MRQVFERLADISVRQITATDWKSYRDYWKSLSNPAHFSGIMNGKDLDDPQTYQALFAAIGDTNIMFGLWDKDKIIGQTGLFFDTYEGQPAALFQGSEIQDDYRGFGFSKNLYEARMQYLKDSGYDGKIITSIRPDNQPSLRAAEKNGFQNTGQTIHDKIIMARQAIDLTMA